MNTAPGLAQSVSIQRDQSVSVMIARQVLFSYSSQLTHVRKQSVTCGVKGQVLVNPGTQVGGLIKNEQTIS